MVGDLFWPNLMEIVGIPVSTNFEPLYLAPSRIESVTDGADEARNWPLGGYLGDGRTLCIRVKKSWNSYQICRIDGYTNYEDYVPNIKMKKGVCRYEMTGFGPIFGFEAAMWKRAKKTGF
ncbi:hypothetical protein TRIATDRAFT_286377 [Trichoderma atroviride IMI 206040]|uniref:Uncharacterized protein n=1 Tax=Hypocrea atroviridis (strain ATCC 20476 / IMI 206040) TaxID=452589 RepID=G9P7G6_HYPAI|nr:uncharacterized protein TRIATDRAFT_286377 [Trichoderma atroviride IMI 206040]EHK40781.1 hypothetical protein TRIATDRAFT_286377 [Trichoderma atroviride IMI 206040]